MLSYTDGPFVIPNVTAQAGEPDCTVPMSCSDFVLTVGTIANAANRQIEISVGWPVATADFDVYIYAGSPVPPGASAIATSASSADPEVVVLPATATVYTVRVVPFAPLGQTYTANVSILSKTTPPPPGTAPAPRYLDYPAPDSAAGADSAGEPSIGVDWNPNVSSLKNGPNPPDTSVTPVMNNINLNTGGVAFFTANLNEFRVDFDDCASPAKNTWTDVTFVTEGIETLDPIGFVDHQLPTASGVESGTGLGRVFQDQLAGATSLLAYSDMDGQPGSWMQSQGSGQPAGVDHQTVGAGPYNSSTVIPPLHPLYPHQVYYASQDIGTAFAARSDDGGLTFGPGVPMWNITQCGGLHGHVKVGPDGTVYVPNKSCTDGVDASMGASVAVSRDNGITWTVKQIRDNVQGYVAGSGDSDPSVGVGADGTVYVGYQNADGHPHIAVSSDFGDTWHDTDVSQGVIQNSVFPEVIAGDGDRAAFGFLGTTTGGGYTGTDSFDGVWYFYIATTVDRGQSYTLVDATNGDPVQLGSICTGGTTCGGDRNLLDFNDLQLDSEGRVVAAFADGCLAPGCSAATIAAHAPPYNESRSALATVIRQSGGPRLLRAYDSQANCTGDPLVCNPTVPGAPRLDSVTPDSNGVIHLNWSQPDNGGSPLTGYKIYRKDSVTNTYAVIATVTTGCPACKTSYDDATATAAGVSYTYKVTALNAQGESASCGEFPVGMQTTTESRCALPGVTLFTDPAGDEADHVSQSDILKVSIGEPYNSTLPNKNEVFFTMKVNNLNPTPLPLRRWSILFSRGSTQWFVAMETDSTGLPNYVYGHITVDPVTGTTTLNTDGTADFGSETPDGTITIGIGTPTPSSGGMPFPPLLVGEPLSSITANTQASLAVLLLADDTAGTGSYTVTGNSSCSPNAAPVAALVGTADGGNSMGRVVGDPPLLVHFDASGSTDSDGTIATYHYDFGDGTAPLNSSNSMVDHIYTKNGTFAARLTVTDNKGAISANTAQEEVEVELPLDGVSSRKTHGSAGDFDINLLPNPTTGVYNTECRSEGSGYRIIYTLGTEYTTSASASSVTVSNGGMVASHGPGPGSNQYQVIITGVSTAQTHNVSVSGLPVNNTSKSGVNGGNATLNNVIGRLDLLVGDVNNNRTVSNADVTEVKGQVSAQVVIANFRDDVNANGTLSNADVTATKATVGSTLP